MADVFISKPHAEIYEIKDATENKADQLRLFPDMDGQSIHLQIRTFKGINKGYGDRGRPRNMIATVHLNADDIRQIVEYARIHGLKLEGLDKPAVQCEGEMAKGIRCDARAKRVSPAGITLCNAHGLSLYGQDAWLSFPTVEERMQ